MLPLASRYKYHHSYHPNFLREYCVCHLNCGLYCSLLLLTYSMLCASAAHILIVLSMLLHGYPYLHPHFPSLFSTTSLAHFIYTFLTLRILSMKSSIILLDIPVFCCFIHRNLIINNFHWAALSFLRN